MHWCRWYVKLGWALALPLMLVCLWLVLYFNDVSVGDPASATPTIDPERPLMIALGDSFISGEGAKAKQYLEGTNRKRNTCHRANSAYPYLVAESLDFRLVNATCSGAVTADILTRGQHPRSPADVFGGRRQLDALSGTGSELFARAGEVDYVVLSIGGNDAGFKEIVVTCLEETNCQRHSARWLDRLEKVGPRLQETYRAIVQKTPQARHVVMTYPQLMVPTPCIDQLSPAEVQWVNAKFLPRLFTIIAFYAGLEGFEVVDNTEAFVGARVCEDGIRKKNRAANILKFTQVDGQVVFDPGSLTRGSFHPTPLGHTLLAARLQHQLESVTSSPPPCRVSCPPVPPPVPLVNPPGTVLAFPAGSRCFGDRIEDERVLMIAAETKHVEVEAAPGSRFCYRNWESSWRHKDASDQGLARISTAPIRKGAAISIEALVQDTQGHWHHAVIAPVSAAAVGQASVFDHVAFWAIAALVLLWAAVAAVPWLMCRRRRARAPAPAG